MPAKVDITPEIEIKRKATDYEGDEVIITIATFATPCTTTALGDVFSVAYLLYNTEGRPDYRDQALYYGAPEFYINKLTKEEMEQQMEYIVQNLENYKFK